MKHELRNRMVRGLASHITAVALVVASCSGCFRIYLPEQAKHSFDEFGPAPLMRQRSIVCSKALQSLKKDSPDASPYSIFLAGQCYEVGFDGVEPSLERAKDLYKLAMTCGSSDGQEAFTRLGGTAQPLKTYEGTFIIPPNISLSECGFSNDLTAAGYAGAIVMLPVAIVGGAALVVLAIPIWMITGLLTGKM
jgi:hypothetical protein